jgi:acyl transferase domain-containing protein/acyl carrier protein
VFTGQGAQHTGMAHQLYLTEPAFRDTIDLCAETLNPLLQHDIRDILYTNTELIHQTRYAQPALFATEYALATLWNTWGITPTTMIGHSLGEWVAATLANIFTLTDALTLTVHRGHYMQEQPPGAMLNIITQRENLNLPPQLTLAAHNSPRDCVISGPHKDITTYTTTAHTNGWTTQPLTTSHAFHHPHMTPAANALHHHLTTTTLHPPTTPIISCTTAQPLTPEQATNPHYWTNQLTTTIEFTQAIQHTTTPTTTYLEIGPGNTLTTHINRTRTTTTPHTLNSLPHRRDKRNPQETMRQALAKLWTAGAEPDLSMQSDGRRRRIPLPTYPFERNRFWFDVPADEPAVAIHGRGMHPLLDRELVRSAGQSVFLTEFAPDRHWALAEHRMLGAAVVPGTTYLEMARVAGVHHLGRPVTSIRNVTFLVPLLVADGDTRTVHTTVRDLPDGLAAEFSVASHDPATDLWTTHAKGVVDTAPRPLPDRVDVSLLRARCTAESVDVGADQAEHDVMTFGERWVHGLRTVHVGQRVALGELTLPDRFRADCDDHVLHPALLDLATGFTGFALAHDEAGCARARADRGFFLPVGYDELIVHGPLPARGLSLIESRPDASLDGEVRTVDVLVCTEDGTPAVTVRGFTTKRVADPERTVARLRSHTRHHTLRWMPAMDIPGGVRSLERVLVMAEPGGVGLALAARLRADGTTVVLAELEDTWRRESDDRFKVPPTPEGLACLLEALAGHVPEHVVHVAAGRDSARTEDQLHTGVHALFHLIRVLSDRGIVPVGLSVVAPVVSRVTGREGVPSAVHAGLFGLASVIAAEQDTEVRCIDIAEDTQLEVIHAELLGDRPPVTVALRDEVRYVRALSALDLRHQPSARAPDQDGVYLISGGLGGLGLAVAQRLAHMVPGVRLALLSRTVPDPDDVDPRSKAKADALRQLAEAGAQVRTYAVDVSVADQVMDTVRRIRADLGRIDCVLHAAGVAGDGFLFRKDNATFRRTFDPKVLGAVALADATADDPPAVTVLFSSTVAVFGAAGQGDYAAANAFLDGFAEELDARGRGAVSIAWTDWLGRGMAFEHGVAQDQGFFRSISVEDGLDSLLEILASRCVRVVVGEVNHARLDAPEIVDLLRRSPVVLSEPLRCATTTGTPRPGPDSPGTGGPALFGRDDGAYSDTERALAGIWAAELDLTELNIHDSSFALGVDSLSALRIAQHIQKKLDVRVSMADLFRHVTVADLASHMNSTTATGGNAT